MNNDYNQQVEGLENDAWKRLLQEVKLEQRVEAPMMLMMVMMMVVVMKLYSIGSDDTNPSTHSSMRYVQSYVGVYVRACEYRTETEKKGMEKLQDKQ